MEVVQANLARFTQTREPLSLSRDERLGQTSVGSVSEIVRRHDKSNRLEIDPVELWRDPPSYFDQMLESPNFEGLERATIATMLVVSGHHKRTLLQEATGYMDDGQVHFPIIKDLEAVKEESYNNKVLIINGSDGQETLYHVAMHPEVMAMTKATRLYPALEQKKLEDGNAFVNELLTHLQFWDEVATIENPRHKGINPYGQHVLSVAHDVMVYLKDDVGDLRPLHQAKKLRTSADFLAHYRAFFGINAEGTQRDPVTLVAKDALAVHDVPAHIGGVARRQNEIHYDSVTDRRLLAYTYGVDAEGVSQETREEFLTVWQAFERSNRDFLFAGWNPETGMNPERNRKINGGIPNQSPLFWLMRQDMHDLVLTNHIIAQQKNRPMLDIVMGNPSHLVSLSRSVMVAATHQPTIDAMLQSPKSQEYTRVASALSEELGIQAMMPYWIDFTDSLDLLRTDARYFEYFIGAHQIRQ